MKSHLLEQISRPERLREIVRMVRDKEAFAAFDLAVKFDISINVIYRDLKALRSEKLIPKSFKFARKVRSGGL